MRPARPAISALRGAPASATRTAPSRAVNAAPNGPISMAAAKVRISDQAIGGGERERIHRAARRQAVALRAEAAAVLHRTRRADG
jgi:hypothetical protein